MSQQRPFLGRIRGNFAGRVLTLAMATALQIVLGVALLPLATRVLSAPDFGAYGLLMSVVALVAAISDGGAGLILPSKFEPASAEERRRLVASLAWLSLAVSTTAGMLLLALWPWHHVVFPSGSLDVIPLAAVLLAAAVMPARAVTSVAVSVFSVTGRGVAIAAQMVAQSVTLFLTTLIALFVFALGTASLFVGVFCGQLAALSVALWLLGGGYVFALPARRWLALTATSAPTAGVAGLVDGLRVVGENALLARVSGLGAVGYLSHARLYAGMLISASNAVAHNVWARSLREARETAGEFDFTGRAWAPVHLGLTIIGLVFVFVGTEIVHVITNGKLDPAADFIPGFVVIALVQSSGKPNTAAIYAIGSVIALSWIRVALVVVGLVALLPAIALLGIWGILAVTLAEALAYRICIRLLTLKYRKVPFQDQFVVLGIMVIAAGFALVQFVPLSLGARMAIMIAGVAALLAAGRHVMADAIAAIRAVLGS